jgi:hypothetical protein
MPTTARTVIMKRESVVLGANPKCPAAVGRSAHESAVPSVAVANPQGKDTKEVSMVNRVCGRVNRTSTVVSMWLQRQSFAIVIALSLIHVGLAYIHTRASCRTDSLAQT